MLSVGGVVFTERQHPTKTHNDAVATMLKFAGTLMHAGSTVCTSNISCASAAARPADAACLLEVAISVVLLDSTIMGLMIKNRVGCGSFLCLLEL